MGLGQSKQGPSLKERQRVIEEFRKKSAYFEDAAKHSDLVFNSNMQLAIQYKKKIKDLDVCHKLTGSKIYNGIADVQVPNEMKMNKKAVAISFVIGSAQKVMKNIGDNCKKEWDDANSKQKIYENNAREALETAKSFREAKKATDDQIKIWESAKK